MITKKRSSLSDSKRSSFRLCSGSTKCKRSLRCL